MRQGQPSIDRAGMELGPRDRNRLLLSIQAHILPIHGGPALEARVMAMAQETGIAEATILAFLRFLFRVDDMFKPVAPPSPLSSSSPAQSVSTSLPAPAEENDELGGTSELILGEVEEHGGDAGPAGEDGGEDDGKGRLDSEEDAAAAAPEVKVAKKRGRKPSVPGAQPELLLTPVKRARKR